MQEFFLSTPIMQLNIIRQTVDDIQNDLELMAVRRLR
jgi:hypothetical protein